MKKKLTSLLLGALLTFQSSNCLATNGECECPYRDSDSDFSKIVLGSACILGLGGLAIYLAHRCNQSIIYDKNLKDAITKFTSRPGNVNFIRSIKWHDNLCWLHSSILLFFHEPHYREFICKFDINRAMNAINSDSLNPKQKADLEVMITLSKIFKELSKNPECLYACVDLERTGLEKELVEKLRVALNDKSIQYSETYEIVSYELYDFITSSANILGGNHKLPNIDYLFRQFIEYNNVIIANRPGHFWIELVLDEGNIIKIGKNISPKHSIELSDRLTPPYQPEYNPPEKKQEVVVIEDDKSEQKTLEQVKPAQQPVPTAESAAAATKKSRSQRHNRKSR